MVRLEISSPFETRVYDIHDPLVTIGSAAANQVILNDPGVAPVHARIHRGKEGYRLELADPDFKLTVNGQLCTERVLKANDKIKVGETVLKITAQKVAGQKAAATSAEARGHGSQRAPREHHAGEGRRAHAHGAHGHGDHVHHHHHHVTKKKMGWPMWVGLGVLAFGLVIVVMQLGGAGAYYAEAASPEVLMQKAEEEFKAGNYVRAQDNLLLAEKYGGSGMQARLQELKARIDEKIRRNLDQTSLTSAGKGLDAMQDLEQKHLSAGPNRAAARELTRTAQSWLTNYRDVVRRWPDTAHQFDKVQALSVKYAADAQLDKPDDVSDVLWQVDRRLSTEPPLYREALTTLDSYLSGHRNDVRGAELYAKKEAILSGARGQFNRHEAEARQHLAAQRFTDARKSLQAMRSVIIDNSWSKIANALEEQINSAEKK